MWVHPRMVLYCICPCLKWGMGCPLRSSFPGILGWQGASTRTRRRRCPAWRMRTRRPVCRGTQWTCSARRQGWCAGHAGRIAWGTPRCWCASRSSWWGRGASTRPRSKRRGGCRAAPQLLSLFPLLFLLSPPPLPPTLSLRLSPSPLRLLLYPGCTHAIPLQGAAHHDIVQGRRVGGDGHCHLQPGGRAKGPG